MKNFTLLLLFSLPLLTTAQQPKQAPVSGTKPAPAVSVNPKPQIKPIATADTIITKDPEIAGREYMVVVNSAGALKVQGAKVNGLKEGVWREYSGNNNMLNKVEEYHLGKKNGAFTTFTTAGMVSLDETYRNDTLHGKRLTYSQGARLKVVENFNKGVLEGERKSYYDDGKIQEESFYANGNREGLTKWYMQSGIPSLEYTYKKGLLDGPAKAYDDKGLVKQEGNFMNDVEEGEWREYVGGELTKKIFYKSGTVVKETVVKKVDSSK
jgi:antitoxin component YwqK of YwqJK toxin-antitoxin module